MVIYITLRNCGKVFIFFWRILLKIRGNKMDILNKNISLINLIKNNDIINKIYENNEDILSYCDNINNEIKNIILNDIFNSFNQLNLIDINNIKNELITYYNNGKNKEIWLFLIIEFIWLYYNNDFKDEIISKLQLNYVIKDYDGDDLLIDLLLMIGINNEFSLNLEDKGIGFYGIKYICNNILSIQNIKKLNLKCI